MNSIFQGALLAQQEVQLTDEQAGLIAGVGMIFNCFFLILAVIVIIGMWKVFTKAGKPGWAAIVPVYNGIVLLEIIGRPLWWIVLMFIPFVNIVIALIVCLDLAKSFGKGGGFGVGLWLLGFIFFPILGFGSDQYRGPSVTPAA